MIPDPKKPFLLNVKDREEERMKMVHDQIEGRGIGYYKILNAMRQIPRHWFVPKEEQANAYLDCALPIDSFATISQPYIVSLMTSLVRPEPDDKVLEIGTGSGYQTALLAAMGCKVYSMDIVDSLVQAATLPLKKLNLMDRIELKSADGYEGWQEKAPFDCILITCAINHLSDVLITQLKPGGKIVAPIGQTTKQQTLTIWTKDEQNNLIEDPITQVVFIPMTGKHTF